MNPLHTAAVSGIDQEGRGVARIGGKTVFIEGALPQETVVCRIVRSRRQFDEAVAERIVRPSPYRTEPPCPHYRRCGGCALQHARFDVQVAYKQRILEDQLQRIGKVRPDYYLPPVYGTAWGYRRRARLSVAHDGAGRLLLGFQERGSHRIADLGTCPVLAAPLSAKLGDIRRLLAETVQAGARVQAVELHAGEHGQTLTLHTRRLPEAARRLLEQAQAAWQPEGWQFWLADKQPPRPLTAAGSVLAYSLPEYGVRLPYRPSDFTQINADMNAVMVRRALSLLEPQAGERIADLFCGLGNFSLPLAACGAEVLGIEGSLELTRRARANAGHNGFAARLRFEQADLFEAVPDTVAAWGRLDKILLDPPRSGAYAVVQALHAPYLPRRIVYVSCNPATFARDAAVLVQKGYRFRCAGIINLFPQTAHVETVACFDWPGGQPGVSAPKPPIGA